MGRSLDPFAAVADFDLAAAVERVKSMPDIEGAWPNPASLSRFDTEVMSWRQLRRFEVKISPYDMGHTPSEESVWHDIGPSPCWLWTGSLHPKGYGRFHLGYDLETKARIDSYAHRIAFEHWVAIPKPGYIVDHECEVKTCCNPAHTWPVSNPENLRLANVRSPWKRRNQYSKE